MNEYHIQYGNNSYHLVQNHLATVRFPFKILKNKIHKNIITSDVLYGSLTLRVEDRLRVFEILRRMFGAKKVKQRYH
jgi:hypothetical protein